MPESSTFAAGDEEPPPRFKQRHRRTRTGCERCRAQRRKCDEGKPRCKRCTDVGAVCKYITHVSFRDKNSWTLSDDVDSKPICASKAFTYPSIEFVLGDGPDQRKTNDNPSISTDGEYPGSGSSSANVPPSPPSPESGQSWPLVGRSSLSSAEIGLLKYYNHRVAPWLDVYDQQQTFGQSVTRLAMASPCVLEGLLQLSAVFSGRPIEIVTRRSVGIFHLQSMMNPPGTESPFSALRMIACFVLARTLLFVDAIPDTWEPSFHGGGAFLYFRKFNFLVTAERQIWFAFLTLILRLEVAYCLMNQRAPVLIPEFICQILNQSKGDETSADQSQQISYASLRSLKLLVDVMNISFPVPQADDDAGPHQPVASPLSHTSPAAKWKELMDELCAWHTNRPLALQPLMEVDSLEATFPTVIFSSGAGISSNALYHTTMLLLLSNRPQSVSLDERYGSSEANTPQTSRLWHARRVCGIAINSEPEHTHCWDPVLIAAFALVARQMTHASQRNNIITCLDSVKAAGWHVDGLINELRGEWDTVLD
ncbi:hypothetical protein HD806DRAFT_204503 [Xylariaceae sp. AK1471]|nr:hypothetical protein HD806DRAFT_204503 [Xylariaceae sp. AK1471]